MSELLKIPELLSLTVGQGLIRIPMELDVPFTNRVKAIVDTPQFRRLSGITQLGLAARVYPGAVHTRFEHALGVFHNALRYLLQLVKDPRFCQMVDTHHAELLMATALLHDLGHWPFCHPVEDMCLPHVPAHEEFAQRFLSPETELGQVLILEWNIQPEEVLELLLGRATTPARQMLQSIISGPIDIDKMDYLERDSLHAGVPYGRNFDKSRLIHSLMVNKAGNGLALSSKGKTAAELMVFARYVMFSEVYWHHAVRSATSMFCRSFYSLSHQLELPEFFLLSEADTIAKLRTVARGTNCERLVEGLFGERRSLYKRVAEYSISQHKDVYDQLARQPYQFLVTCADQLAERLTASLGETVLGTDLVIDGPSRHREIEFRVEIYFPKEGTYAPLSKVSPVVDTLAKRQFDDYVKRVRVFAHPRLKDRISESGCFYECLQEAIHATYQEVKS